MQLAPAASLAGPIFAGQRIGRLDLRLHADQAIFAGRDIGQREGYTTLGRAIAALRLVTDGDAVGAAAIFERDGRFYGQGVTVWSGPNAVDFHAGMFRERGIRFDHDAVRAVVDGAATWTR